jgi:SAM-dependent methyltransferase
VVPLLIRSNSFAAGCNVLQLRRLAWKVVAQTGELRFHQQNEWRQSPDFMRETASLLEWWGYAPNTFDGETIIDVGAGSRLRSRYFAGARIIAIEPLGDRFMKTISWSDLSDAEAVYSVPAERNIPEIEHTAAFAMCINVLDHTFDADAIVANVYGYLKAGGEFALSVDLHADGHGGHMHPVHLDRDAVRSALTRAGFELLREYEGLGPTGNESYGHGHAYTVVGRRNAA